MFAVRHLFFGLKFFIFVAMVLVGSNHAQATPINGNITSNLTLPNGLQLASLERRPSEINRPVSGRITRTGEIYLLRGLANVFSRGMDTMGAKMVRKGLDARVFNHAAWQELANNIVARSRVKRVSYPIIIMGHSLGGNAAVKMAKYLVDRGIRVQYVVAFDPTVTTSVGKNVSRVINFYLPNDRNSNVVKKSRGFRGTVKNINMTGVRNITHTTIEKDTKLQSQVINRTFSYTKKSRRRR